MKYPLLHWECSFQCGKKHSARQLLAYAESSYCQQLFLVDRGWSLSFWRTAQFAEYVQQFFGAVESNLWTLEPKGRNSSELSTPTNMSALLSAAAAISLCESEDGIPSSRSIMQNL
jgi:hypothetical protein